MSGQGSGYQPKDVQRLVEDTLRAAMKEHQAGNLQAAEAAYRQILQVMPDQPDANHFLGMIAFQCGALQPALEHLQRSVDLQPGISAWRSNFATALVGAGFTAEAEKQARAAVELDPRNVEGLFQLGYALSMQMKMAEAVSALDAVLDLAPLHVGANLTRGTAAVAAGDLDGALKLYERAAKAAPDHLDAQMNLGNLHRARGEHRQAEVVFRSILAKAPNHPGAKRDLIAALRDLGRFDEAAEIGHAAVEANPNDGGILNAYANVLMEQGRLDESLARYDQAVTVAPASAEARANRSLVRLLRGDFPGGLEDFEWRRRLITNDLPQQWTSLPAWDGQVRPGLSLLLYAEQGFGDAIQFVRYAGILAALGVEAHLFCREPLRRLLAGTPGLAGLAVEGGDHRYDARANLMSLPHLLGTRAHTIPAEVPYLRPSDEAVAKFADIAAAPGLKVGVVWKGSDEHARDRLRSCPRDDLLAALAANGVSLFSLQLGKDAASLPAGITDLAPRIADFMDTAGAIANLDLVIAVDTAAIHLAGAMAKPVWVMLQYVPDWRWMLARGDSPWYPTARLFRQPSAGDWPAVFAGLRAELVRLAGG